MDGMGRWTIVCINGWMDRSLDPGIFACVDGGMEGWMDGWMHG